MNTSTRQQHLHLKLARAVFWTALLLALLTSVALFMAEFQWASEKTETRLNQLLDTVETTAAVAAYSGNSAIGADVLDGLLRNDIVHEARLLNDRGLDLHRLRETGHARVPPGPVLVRDLHSPFGEREVVGRLLVFPEARVNLREARHAAQVGALTSSVLIGLTALLVLGLVRSSLSLPLSGVSGALHAIRAGEQERLKPLPHHRDDELGQLVNDINGLLATLEEKFAAERLLRKEVQVVERRLREVFENTSAGIFLLDGQGHLCMANPTLGRVLGLPGLSPESLVGQDFPALAFADPEQFHHLFHQAGSHSTAMDLKLRHHDAGPAWVHCLLSRQTDGQGETRYEGVVYDITERRALELRTQHEADHDLLTGLLRRHAAERELRRRLDASSHQPQAVLLLDLDHFKAVNDTHGHAAGDRVLLETAQRFKSCVRSGDIVGRLGGDEFLIALLDCASLDQARRVAHEIVDRVVQPIALDQGIGVTIGISIGIALSHGQGLEDLLRAADLAMYEVKRWGRNGYASPLPEGAIRVERRDTAGAWTQADTLPAPKSPDVSQESISV
ncbi:PAS domain S-box-containing protein/diguanylate cyclase (GGDEF) domain-containing protein [Methylomagnum ishizawai]|uniref:PAS domain S-box-containing protein/diguanylate cyclase (GGDEF) domain-containing protein n=1 Tax=Methylomagnum ishizawai TaxID=1760988 RepID=A0A1Y6D0Z6_9GAMM|nr:sensor domain-containing diguanylate cyclase [Methylomagnum ishizawai]SMF96100.1 PAS domain S-box-containing protein/diguanylate cyclase (GGDEF) domain-containing protein [Methylomagnum ishizawai]